MILGIYKMVSLQILPEKILSWKKKVQSNQI